MPRFAAEAPWAWRLATRYLQKLPALCRTETAGRDPLVADAEGDAGIVLVQADPEAYLLPAPAKRLIASLVSRENLALVLAVSNEAEAEEARVAPPFAYLTPTLLSEAVAFVAASAGPPRAAASPASPVYAARRSLLRALPQDLPLRLVPAEAGKRGLAIAIEPGAYVHRYGAMDASAREDLAALVPPGAETVLDVGCARGATGGALRARGVRHVVGIEPDSEDAAAASLLYDEVLQRRLEEVREAFDGRFDAILFGDVLEHLADPSEALVQVRPWLSPRGVLVASVPNAGHWAIVEDLIRGRFDYVPYSILSGTHLRLFTRSTLTDLFEASGYRVTWIDTQVLPISPEGEKRRDRLARFPGASPDLDVYEFLAVARPLS